VEPQTPPLQLSVVHALPSLQSLGVLQGVQPGMVGEPQTPPLQLSVVHALPSLQSLGVLQGVQPGMAWCAQPTPSVQESTVQALPSPQFGARPAWQPLAPPQVSTPLQGLPSSQPAFVFSSTVPSQSLSRPSQSSPPLPLRTSITACALTLAELMATALATLVKSSSAQVGVA